METFIIYILLMLLIFGIVGLYLSSIYNKFQSYIIRINEAESVIDENLRKRFDLLNRSINIIRANLDEEVEILEDIVKLRSRKLSNFDLDRRLITAMNEFYVIKEKFPTLVNSSTYNKICTELDITEEYLTSSKAYFNQIITRYNKLIRTFPSNLMGKILKYKEKTFFDNKDMFDEIFNDFKL